MKINQIAEGSKLILALEGRLDTTTAPELEKVLKETMDNINDLIMDLASLDYISSAGLRVILAVQKKMNAKKGKMIIKNVNSTLMEVFEITGFVDILTFE